MIAKSEAHTAALNAHQQKMAELEKRIDDAVKSWSGTGSICVDVDEYPRVVIDAVVDLYRDGGWSVSYSNNQRDGASLTLS